MYKQNPGNRRYIDIGSTAWLDDFEFNTGVRILLREFIRILVEGRRYSTTTYSSEQYAKDLGSIELVLTRIFARAKQHNLDLSILDYNYALHCFFDIPDALQRAENFLNTCLGGADSTIECNDETYNHLINITGNFADALRQVGKIVVPDHFTIKGLIDAAERAEDIKVLMQHPRIKSLLGDLVAQFNSLILDKLQRKILSLVERRPPMSLEAFTSLDAMLKTPIYNARLLCLAFDRLCDTGAKVQFLNRFIHKQQYPLTTALYNAMINASSSVHEAMGIMQEMKSSKVIGDAKTFQKWTSLKGWTLAQANIVLDILFPPAKLTTIGAYHLPSNLNNFFQNLLPGECMNKSELDMFLGKLRFYLDVRHFSAMLNNLRQSRRCPEFADRVLAVDALRRKYNVDPDYVYERVFGSLSSGHSSPNGRPQQVRSSGGGRSGQVQQSKGGFPAGRAMQSAGAGAQVFPLDDSRSYALFHSGRGSASAGGGCRPGSFVEGAMPSPTGGRSQNHGAAQSRAGFTPSRFGVIGGHLGRRQSHPAFYAPLHSGSSGASAGRGRSPGGFVYHARFRQGDTRACSMGGFALQQMPSSVGGHSRQVQQSAGSFFEGEAVQAPPSRRPELHRPAQGGHGVIGDARHGQSFGSTALRHGGLQWHPMSGRGVAPPSAPSQSVGLKVGYARGSRYRPY